MHYDTNFTIDLDKYNNELKDSMGNIQNNHKDKLFLTKQYWKEVSKVD